MTPSLGKFSTLAWRLVLCSATPQLSLGYQFGSIPNIAFVSSPHVWISQLYVLLFECYSDRSEWKQGLASVNDSLRCVPPDFQVRRSTHTLQ